MAADREPRFYVALLCSGISVFSWLGSVVALGYTLFTLFDGGSTVLAAGVTVGLVVAGAVFAKAEARLYSVDEVS